MNSSNQGLDTEQSRLMLDELLATSSTAAALEYARDVFAYMEYLHGTVGEVENVFDPWTSHNSLSTEVKRAGLRLQLSYAGLMIVIGQMRECIDPASARSRHATERLKRLIIRAKKAIMTLRECLLDIERSSSK